MLSGDAYFSHPPEHSPEPWCLVRGRHTADEWCAMSSRFSERVNQISPEVEDVRGRMFCRTRKHILHLHFSAPAASFELFGPEESHFNGWVPPSFVLDLLHRLAMREPLEDLVRPYAVVEDSYGPRRCRAAKVSGREGVREIAGLNRLGIENERVLQGTTSH